MKGAAQFALLGLVGGLACTPQSPSQSPAKAPDAVVTRSAEAKRFDVRYREAANVFEVLDNVSAWWKDKNDPEYRDAWQTRFGVSAEDERAFARYGEIRKRYYPEEPESTPSEGRLFARPKAADRIAEAFFLSDTIADALSRVATIVKPAELADLRAFYARFDASTSKLLAESRPYAELARSLDAKLADPRAAAFARRIAQAYAVTDASPLTVLYVWWPPVDHVTANNRGRVLLLKYNPTAHADDAAHDTDVPIHEYVHYVSAQQPDDRNRALSATFAKGCDLGGAVKPTHVVEEPFAVAYQKLFLRATDPKRVDYSSAWYGGDPWVGPMAKMLVNLLEQHLDGGGTMDDALMRRSARLCAQLVKVRTTAPRTTP